jgi:Pvc16 N-terminal domain
MSSALAISGVTAVLEYLLNNVYSSAGLGSVTVSAVAPDIVQGEVGAGADTPLQVNLFMHQVTHNAAYRNIGLPSLGSDGSTQLANQPLALDLHYLLTAYGSMDCEAEALLGYAIQLVHETPVLPRAVFQPGLSSLPSSNPLSTLLGASGLANQIEMIKFTPTTINREELAWLWTALKADYRPSYLFDASVVLIQAQKPLLSALPVLQRKLSAQPSVVSPLPALTAINPPNGQPAACLTDTVTVTGTNLTGATAIVLSNARLGESQTITPLQAVGATSFQFTVPDAGAYPDLGAGLYLASAQISFGGGAVATNGLPLAIAPKLGAGWPPATLASGPSVALTVPCTPYLRPGQQISLLIGGQEAPVGSVTAPTRSPSFTFASLQPTGQPVPVWLRVDGVDSPLIDVTSKPPAFSGPFVRVT